MVLLGFGALQGRRPLRDGMSMVLTTATLASLIGVVFDLVLLGPGRFDQIHGQPLIVVIGENALLFTIVGLLGYWAGHALRARLGHRRPLVPSPDGQQVWDGEAWRQLSPDGSAYWDGQAWVDPRRSRPRGI
jgi:hypothetical protein